MTSYVVTGGGRGVGRAIAERLAGQDATVAVVELDPAALSWVDGHPAGPRMIGVAGSAADEAVAQEAAGRAQAAGRLAGWVNNAAVFRDAALDAVPAGELLDLVALNLAPALTGCATAVRSFLAAGTGGAIVNVSSHQAQRAVRGAPAYATAKAAVEGLTRAVAVDYGSAGIRANAVALGSIETERYTAYLAGQRPEDAERTRVQMAQLHPLGRVGSVDEVAAAVAWLLSDEASFVTGAVIPIDAAGRRGAPTRRRSDYFGRRGAMIR